MDAKNIRPSAKRDDRIVRPRRAQISERSAQREYAPEVGTLFTFYFHIGSSQTDFYSPRYDTLFIPSFKKYLFLCFKVNAPYLREKK